MMSAVSEWLSGVLYTSVIIAIFIAVSDGFEIKSAVKWAAGGVMLFALLSPAASFKNIKLPDSITHSASPDMQNEDFESLLRSQTIISASGTIESEISEYCRDRGMDIAEVRVYLNVDEYNSASVNRIEIDIKEDIPLATRSSASRYIATRYMIKNDAIMWNAGGDYER